MWAATGTQLPSEQVHGRVYGCIFDDLFGLKSRDEVGVEQILFETDYPHSDGTFPHSRKVAHDLFVAAGMNAEECYKVVRGQRHRGLRPPPLRHHRLTSTNGVRPHMCSLRRGEPAGCLTPSGFR